MGEGRREKKNGDAREKRGVGLRGERRRRVKGGERKMKKEGMRGGQRIREKGRTRTGTRKKRTEEEKKKKGTRNKNGKTITTTRKPNKEETKRNRIKGKIMEAEETPYYARDQNTPNMRRFTWNTKWSPPSPLSSLTPRKCVFGRVFVSVSRVCGCLFLCFCALVFVLCFCFCFFVLCLLCVFCAL